VYVLSWDLGTLLWVARTPYEGVRISFQGSELHTWRSWTDLGGPDCISRGPALSHGGPDLLLMPWSISPSLDTWCLWTHPCGRVRHCCGPRVAARGWGESWPGPTHSTFTTRLRDSRVGTTPLYSSKGYPSFRAPTEPIILRDVCWHAYLWGDCDLLISRLNACGPGPGGLGLRLCLFHVAAQLLPTPDAYCRRGIERRRCP
jgi:hypothetical protein